MPFTPIKRVLRVPLDLCQRLFNIFRYAPPAPFTPSLLDYFRQQRIVFAFWFHMRRYSYSLRARLFPRRSTLRSYDFSRAANKGHIVEKVLPYNIGQIGDIYRWRTERLINILRCVGQLDQREAKVLVIGPRNEAELLLFSLYGFPLKNLTGVDLFTYSPLIQVMDMHDFNFPDNSFDVVYSSFVLRYSDNVKRAVSEMIRVSRDSALIAIGLAFGIQTDVVGTPFENGLQDLYSYFEGYIKHVYWDEDLLADPKTGNRILTTIFRIQKPVPLATSGTEVRPDEVLAREPSFPQAYAGTTVG
jgi:hypothetical protein